MTTRSAPPSVDTSKVANRRSLRFVSLDEAISEAQRVADAETAGTAKYLGNWNAGQILNHLGAWAELAYGGNPIRVPFFVRWFGPMMLKKFLQKGLPAGHWIPKVPNGTIGTEKVGVGEGLARMKAGFLRLKTDQTEARHPLFGAMTREQYVELNLRHAELHLSFVII